ncbi:endolytic transglycosylase MltG, partial [Bacillus thuringiensis]
DGNASFNPVGVDREQTKLRVFAFIVKRFSRFSCAASIQRVLYEDLKINSPYNTYVAKGLPVGPIANSGKHSVEAALEPAQTDYYYFLAAPTGEVYYAKTLEEHNALKQKYITKKQ